ncbi:SET domain-containing protein [Haliangium sp.]|uniref:SET domain-containing protein n=1 Tax=Haliangium sp. TaxID=2663208 RepID=UPI003D13E969
MSRRPASYGSPKLHALERGSKGRGVLTTAPIVRDELIAVFGGDVVHADELAAIPAGQRRLLLQVEDELYLLSDQAGVPDYINHSCQPNAGLRGPVTLVAMRDIAAGEEICFDYAMSDGSDYDAFDCACGAPNCRGRVSGADWREPLLWRRYQGYFSPYLQRRIDALAGAGQRPDQVRVRTRGRAG